MYITKIKQNGDIYFGTMGKAHKIDLRKAEKINKN